MVLVWICVIIISVSHSIWLHEKFKVLSPPVLNRKKKAIQMGISHLDLCDSAHCRRPPGSYRKERKGKSQSLFSFYAFVLLVGASGGSQGGGRRDTMIVWRFERMGSCSRGHKPGYGRTTEMRETREREKSQENYCRAGRSQHGKIYSRWMESVFGYRGIIRFHFSTFT